jgi:hypothetical protein
VFFAEIQFQLAPIFDVMGANGYALHRDIVNLEKPVEDVAVQTQPVSCNEPAKLTQHGDLKTLLSRMLLNRDSSAAVPLLSSIHGPGTQEHVDNTLSKPPLAVDTISVEPAQVQAQKQTEVEPNVDKASEALGALAGVGVAAAAAAAASRKQASANETKVEKSSGSLSALTPLTGGGIAPTAATAGSRKQASSHEPNGDESSRSLVALAGGGIAAAAAAAPSRKQASANETKVEKSSGSLGALTGGGIAAAASRKLASAHETKVDESSRSLVALAGGGIAAAVTAAASRSQASVNEPKEDDFSGSLGALAGGGIAAATAATASRKQASTNKPKVNESSESLGALAGGGIAAAAAAAASRQQASAKGYHLESGMVLGVESGSLSVTETAMTGGSVLSPTSSSGLTTAAILHLSMESESAVVSFTGGGIVSAAKAVAQRLQALSATECQEAATVDRQHTIPSPKESCSAVDSISPSNVTSELSRADERGTDAAAQHFTALSLDGEVSAADMPDRRRLMTPSKGGGIGTLATVVAEVGGQHEEMKQPQAPRGGIAAPAAAAASAELSKSSETLVERSNDEATTESIHHVQAASQSSNADELGLKGEQSLDGHNHAQSHTSSGTGIAAAAAAAAAAKRIIVAATKKQGGETDLQVHLDQGSAVSSKNAHSQAPPSGGIAAAAAAAAAAKRIKAADTKKLNDADDVQVHAGGGSATEKDTEASKAYSVVEIKPSVQDNPDGDIAPSGGCNSEFQVDEDLLTALMEVGVVEASTNPRDLSSFYCLHLLAQFKIQSTLMSNDGEETGGPSADADDEPALNDILALSRQCLLRSLAITNQATSIGMVGWLEYGSSDPLERAMDLPFDVLQKLACNYAVCGDWTGAIDVLSALVLRCEKQLPSHHPTTLSSLIDLAAATMMASHTFAKGILGSVADRLSLYLSEQETAYFDTIRKRLAFENAMERVFQLECSVDPISMLKAFVNLFQRQLSREFLSLIGPDHPVALANKSFVGDALAVLANCLTTDERTLVETKDGNGDSGKNYFWSLAYKHYYDAFKGWVRLHSLSHPNAASAVFSIARCLRELGRLDKALQVLNSLAHSLGWSESITRSDDEDNRSFSRHAVFSFLPPNWHGSGDNRMSLRNQFECSQHQTYAMCLWMMAVFTVEQSRDERGRIRALSLLHGSSEALQRALVQIGDHDQASRSVSIEMYNCVEQEARNLFQPLQLVQQGWNEEEEESHEEDVPKKARWDALTPMRPQRWENNLSRVLSMGKVAVEARTIFA